jgi:nicotinate phosphoribosyltransferase
MQSTVNNFVSFDYLFRKLPYNGGNVAFAGPDDILTIFQNLHFTDDDIYFLEQLYFNNSDIEYLKRFSFSCNVYACTEGEVVFPNCPLLRVEGNMIEAQLAETIIIRINRKNNFARY